MDVWATSGDVRGAGIGCPDCPGPALAWAEAQAEVLERTTGRRVLAEEDLVDFSMDFSTYEALAERPGFRRSR